MQLKLFLKDEKEFLDEIKTLIKEQIKGITREEYIEIVKNTVDSKVSLNLDPERFMEERILKRVDEIITTTINKAFNVYSERDLINILRKKFDDLVNERVDLRLRYLKK